MEKSKKNSTFISKIKKFIKINRLAFRVNPFLSVVLFIFNFIQSLIPLGLAWNTKLIFDLLAVKIQTDLNSAGNLRNLMILIFIQIGLSLSVDIFGNLNNYLSSVFNKKIAFFLQMSTYEKLNELLGLETFETAAFHDTIQLGTNGALMGLTQSFSITYRILNITINIICFIGVLFTFNPWLTFFIIAANLPRLFLQSKLGRKRFVLSGEINPSRRKLSYFSFILTSLDFVKELRLFQLGTYFLEKYSKLYKKIEKVELTQEKREGNINLLMSLISILVFNIVFVVVILQAFRGLISLGDITLFTTAVTNIQSSLGSLFLTLAGVDEVLLFYSRYDDLLNIPQSIYVEPNPRVLQELKFDIKFENISFRYQDNGPRILKQMNLKIPAGKCLALVGLNGAGKTTLVKLLTRLYDPDEGSILWNGVDIRCYDPQDLRKRIGVIFQDFIHYEFSALENIAVGDVNKLFSSNFMDIEPDVRKAAKKTGIDQKLSGLPEGYQTILSRWLDDNGNGVDLSGGEWQKIALARLFMRDADFFILDEPTAALDVQAEQEIYNQFRQLINGKTCLLISHRFSSIRMADVIAVLDEGKIVEYGSHEELIRKNGKYAHLYQMQAARYT